MDVMRKKTSRIILVFLVPIVIIAMILIAKVSVNFLSEKAMVAIDYTVNMLRTEAIEPELQKVETPSGQLNILNDELSDIVLSVEIANETLEIDTSISKDIIEIDSLYSTQPISVEIAEISGTLPDGAVVYVNGENIEEVNYIELDNLQKDQYIDIRIEYEDLLREYFIQTLPSDFPEIEKVGVSDIEGIYYTNIYANDNIGRNVSYIVKMSEFGEILYYKRNNLDYHIADFARWNIDGSIRQTYFENTPIAGFSPMVGYGQGEYVVMDEQYNELDRVQALPSAEYDLFETSIDHHDFIYLNDNHYMVVKYFHTHPNPEHENRDIGLTPSSNIAAAYIQEIKDDEIIWEWSSTDYPEFYTGSVENNDFSNKSSAIADYVHINSISIDPKDSNVVASLRNQDSVVKINRKTNEIEWFLGGENDSFGLSNEQMPSRQHHASYTEAGNLILFDNGNEHEQTRILEFELDEENMEVLDFKEFKIDDYFGMFTGSVQKIDEENDVFVIGWGMNRNHYNLMSEIDFKNMEVKTEVITNDLGDDTYRFLKYTE